MILPLPIIHSIGTCRMRPFLAVLRSFFCSSLLYTLSFHPFPPTSLPSSLTSSCHLFPITFIYTKYELMCWSLKGVLWGSDVFKSLVSRIPKLDPWIAWIYLSMDSLRDWWYTLSDKNPSTWNFLSPKPEVTCGTVAIILQVILLSPYLRVRGVSVSSIHYNQSHRIY
jgi:hypothetical protein